MIKLVMYRFISCSLKDQVFEKFLEWKALVEKSTGRKFKAIHTDNGGEFTSKEFEAHLTKEGIWHKLTVLKTPEQNEVAELVNQPLVETTRTILLDVNLPQEFWEETLFTATYLQNRSSTKAVCGMVSHEAWTGKNCKLKDFASLGVKPLYTYPKTRERNWTHNPESVFSWDME